MPVDHILLCNGSTATCRATHIIDRARHEHTTPSFIGSWLAGSSREARAGLAGFRCQSADRSWRMKPRAVMRARILGRFKLRSSWSNRCICYGVPWDIHWRVPFKLNRPCKRMESLAPPPDPICASGCRRVQDRADECTQNNSHYEPAHGDPAPRPTVRSCSARQGFVVFAPDGFGG